MKLEIEDKTLTKKEVLNIFKEKILPKENGNNLSLAETWYDFLDDLYDEGSISFYQLVNWMYPFKNKK